MLINSLEDALKEVKFQNYKPKERNKINLQLLLMKENKTYASNYNEKDLKSCYFTKQDTTVKKGGSKKSFTKLHNSFGVKNSSVSPTNLVQKSRNNKKSVYHDFILEKKSFNNDQAKKNKINNNMTLSPQKQFLSINFEKQENKNVYLGLVHNPFDYTKKIGKIPQKSTVNSNLTNNSIINSIKTQTKVKTDYLSKPTTKCSVRDKDMFNLSSAVLLTNSDEPSSNNTLTRASQPNSHHQKNKSCNLHKEFKFNNYLHSLLENKLNTYREKIRQIDFFSLFECFSLILDNLAKVDENFVNIAEMYNKLIDFENSKAKHQTLQDHNYKLQWEIEKLNKSVAELKEINKNCLKEVEKKENDLKTQDKKYKEEVEFYQKREQKFLRILYLIETGGISLNQVININSNNPVGQDYLSVKNYELSENNSKKLTQVNSNNDITVYFPDKTPPVRKKNNSHKSAVPKLDFNNLPKYESPIPSQGFQLAEEENDSVNDHDPNMQILSFNEKISFENINRLDENIESIDLSSQSTFKMKNTPLCEDLLSTKKQFYTEANANSVSSGPKNNESLVKSQIKQPTQTQSYVNINELISNKKYYDLKKLSQSKKLIQSFKSFDNVKGKQPVKVKTSDSLMNNIYLNTDGK